MEIVVTAKIKLLPSEVQHEKLVETMSAIKKGLNFASQVAYEHDLLSVFKKLQKLTYTELREGYGLKSQMACNVCTIVAGTYASMKSNGENTLATYQKAKLQYSYNRDYSFTKEGLISIGTLALASRWRVVDSTRMCMHRKMLSFQKLRRYNKLHTENSPIDEDRGVVANISDFVA